MAGRPVLELGAYGNISAKQVSEGAWRAVAWQRHPTTGERRQVRASSNTEAKAKAALKSKMDARVKTPTSIGTPALSRMSTVAQLIELYIAELDDTDLASATVTRYTRTARFQILPAIGQRRLHELTQGTFAKLILDEHKKSPSEAKLIRAVSGNLMTLALRHDAVASNTAVNAAGHLPKVEKADPETLTPDTAEQMFDLLIAAKDRSRPGPNSRKGSTDLIDVLSLQLALGARVSEVAAIQVQDIDWTAEPPVITIHQAVSIQGPRGRKLGARKYEIPGFYFVQPYTKAKDVRRVVLDDFAIEILRRRVDTPGTGGLIFYAATGAPLNLANLRRSMRAALAGSEVEFASTHSMRRSIASEVGHHPEFGPEAAQKLLGHGQLSTTIRSYISRDVSVSDVRKVSAKFGRRVL
ncbi:tyrosine-type recombinase/integrase [Cryobacterium sp. 10C2]|uniref:tyrosine-type recombinase/integrase n=2 Tax=unclassified Cryobacterium TaxID=2649013 RepID=UPI002B2275F6|nr:MULTISPECIES: tyrosine-type recombinase/integrase [unclassified Cryobacterium]MEB0289141.1 tyrosine-type recombinase/integrase [Cryobacterium sp. 10C2]